MANRFDPTEEQLKILESSHDIKRVIACAGSGKTWVLTSSIINMLSKEFVKPSEILALTFTNNAAENMRDRISSAIGKKYDMEKLNIYTFNSFGNAIIKDNSFVLDLGKGFSLINEVQSWKLIYDIFKDFRFTTIKVGKNVGKVVQDILIYINNLKNNLIKPGDFDYEAYRDYLESFKSKALKADEEKIVSYQKELFDIYALYEELKRKNNYIDYSDQIFLPYLLLKENKVLKEKYRQRFKVIFVDEFQDTDISQAHFLSLLYKKGFNRIMIVGDDDQGIYSFRGACIDNFVHFENFYLNSKCANFFLTTNFRSGKNIIDFNNEIISHNTHRIKKIVQPEHESKEGRVLFYHFHSVEEENEQIVKNIVLLKNKGYRLKDMAVLCRKKRFSDLIKKLEKNNIKYELIGGKNFFFEPEVLFIISWLRVLYDVFENANIIYLLKSSKYKISDRDIHFLYAHKEKDACERSLINGILNRDSNLFVSKEAKARLADFLEELQFYLKNMQNLTLSEVINLIFYESGLYYELKSRFGNLRKKKIKNMERLISIAADFENNNLKADFDSFVIYLKEIAKTDYEDEKGNEVSRENSIKLMSIHAAKGLEFDIVFCPMLWKNDYFRKARTSNKFEIPSKFRKDGTFWAEKNQYFSKEQFYKKLSEKNIEEERRIFYVACSRARKILMLSFSDYALEEEHKKEGLPFLKEAFHDFDRIEIIGAQSYACIRDNFHSKVSGFQEGLKVAHQRHEEKKIKIKSKTSRSVPEILQGLSEAQKNIIGPINASKVECLKPETIAAAKKGQTDTSYSLSEIITYMQCPMLYKWQYLFHIPQRIGDSQKMGEKVHKIFEIITHALWKNKNNDDFLKKIFIHLKENDPDNVLLPIVENFLGSILCDFSKTKEIYMEKLFYYRISDFFISAKFDRLDMQNNGLMVLYDYKLTSSKNRKDREDYMNQLKAYVLGISDLFQMPVQDINASIYYLKDDKISKHCFSQKEISDFKKTLIRSLQDITAGKMQSKKCPNIACYYQKLCD
jgi:DNA helicase II / ATP-dependent DNA helicase PcrA